MIYTEFQAEEDLRDIIEDTFDTCSSNRDEIRWINYTFTRFYANSKQKT